MGRKQNEAQKLYTPFNTSNEHSIAGGFVSFEAPAPLSWCKSGVNQA
jgi:hypothetical protein